MFHGIPDLFCTDAWNTMKRIEYGCFWGCCCMQHSWECGKSLSALICHLFSSSSSFYFLQLSALCCRCRCFFWDAVVANLSPNVLYTVHRAMVGWTVMNYERHERYEIVLADYVALCDIVWHCALHSEPRRPPSKLWLCWIRSGARLPARHGPGVHGFGTQTPSEYSIWYVSSDVCCCIDGMNEPAYSGMRVRSSKLGARMCIFPSAPTWEQNIIWYWSARNPLRLSQLWSSIFFNLYINIYKYTWEWLTSLYHKNGLHEQGRL